MHCVTAHGAAHVLKSEDSVQTRDTFLVLFIEAATKSSYGIFFEKLQVTVVGDPKVSE